MNGEIVLRKLRRLRAASPQELSVRAMHKASVARERWQYTRGRLRWTEEEWRGRLFANAVEAPSNGDLAADLDAWMHRRPEPPFLLGKDSLISSKSLAGVLFPNLVEESKTQADILLKGTATFFRRSYSIKEPIHWHCDLNSDRVWPRVFYGDVPIFAGADKFGDVKYVWELSRHEFLIESAKAYFLTGDDKYARWTFGVIHSWIDESPYLEGVHWTSALEVAVRSLCWLWVLQFCRGYDGLSAERRLEMIQSLYQHGRHLARHLSFYFSPYNHLIGEAAALYLLGCYFPEFDEAPSWREVGWRTMSSLIDKQFHADGGTVEQATSYHHFTLGFYVLAMLVRMERGETVPPRFRQTIERAFEYSLWITRPDGRVPMIGDTDDAHSLRFQRPEPWNYRRFHSIGATLLSRGDMKSAGGGFSEDALWLLGAHGHRRYQLLEEAPSSEKSRTFARTGCTIFRTGIGPNDHQCSFDHGPIAEGLFADDVASAAHGHSDMLSLEVAAFGRPVLVEAGSYTYNGALAWHRYFRESKAHNTVEVDGASQARYTGRLSWSCVARPESAVRKRQANGESIEGAHSGFFGLRGQVRHRRALYWRGDEVWWIFDRLEGVGVHQVDLYFHFAPGRCRLRNQDCAVEFESDAGVRALLSLVDDSKRFEATISHGGPKPADGWIAVGYDCKVAAPLARFQASLELPADFASVLIASEGSLDRASVHSIEGRAGVREVRIDDRRVRLKHYWTPSGLQIVDDDSSAKEHSPA